MNPQTSNLKQLAAFFILAFVIGWLAWIPLLVNREGPTWSAFIFLFSPAISALLVAGFTNKLAGIKDILRRYLLWKFQVKWYLLAFLLIPAIFFLAILILFRGNDQSLWTNAPWYFVAASFLYLMFINSGEEIGWRGFALPRLQSIIPNPLIASIILGVIWGTWHLPQYFVPGQPNIPVIPFLLLIAGLSIIYTVVFNNTRGSLLFAVILHASTDIVPRIVQTANFDSNLWWLIAGLTWITGIILNMVTKESVLNKVVNYSQPRSSI
ncbi:MAG: CPBP family intramembrane metalloprotease [Chloroflexi bacterium]|nr:CPBP family intramembrane metalloprotease [Chloroflexota bacterium]